jgi:hypothetical protein
MSQFDQVHSTKKYRLGTRKRDVAGNEYIYLQGVASCVAYDAVTFDEAFVTIRAIANAKGRVAIAQAAVDATTEYGWFMIYGTTYVQVSASFGDNGNLFLTATAGELDDADVAGDAVHGAVGRSVIDATGNPSGTAKVELNYPMVLDAATD